MPSRKMVDGGEFRDIAHPINAETRKDSRCNFEEYEKVLTSED